MNYYKINDAISTKKDTYLEVERGTALRQITISDKEVVSSNIKSAEYHFCLFDQEVDVVNPVYIEIKREDFENAWKVALKQYYDKWGKKKKKYPIGSEIEGRIEINYPQGTILEIEDEVYAVADYEEARMCRFIGTSIKGCVYDYDNDNLWLKINNLYPTL